MHCSNKGFEVTIMLFNSTFIRTILPWGDHGVVSDIDGYSLNKENSG